MASSFFSKQAGLYYDSDESPFYESDTDPDPPQGNVSTEGDYASHPVHEEEGDVDDLIRSDAIESDEDGDKHNSNGNNGDDNEGGDSPRAIIFVIDGLRKPIDWKAYTQPEVPRSTIINIPLVAELAINDSHPYTGMINQAKRLLDVVLSHVTSDTSDTSPIALGFWASDLGGSIVKKVIENKSFDVWWYPGLPTGFKALVIASQDPHYSMILDYTSLLVFFGTLHRVSAFRSWEAILIQWTHAYYEERAIPNFLDLVDPLTTFHKQLSIEFENITRCHSMRIVNYYEMNSGLGSDDKFVTRFNATFGGLSQARIATPDMNSPVRLYQNQSDFLGRKTQDEIDRLKSDYLGALELLALHSPIAHMRPSYNMGLDNLAKYILTKPDFKKWLHDATIPSLKRSVGAESNNSNVFPRGILALKLINPLQDLDIMANALICSIDDVACRPEDIYITLQPGMMLGRKPLTKRNLMASACHQLLVARPSLFTHIKSILADSRDGLHGSNIEWVDRILGLCLRSLLIGANTARVLIIIEQPEDPCVAASFLDFTCLMRNLIETTETTRTKIIILSRAAHRGLTADEPNMEASVYWDFDDKLGIPILNIGIDPTSLEFRNALINDYTNLIADSSMYDDQSQIIKADIELVALKNLTKLEAFQAAVALAQKSSFSTLKPMNCLPDFNVSSQNVVARIMDLLPKSIEKIAWTGLLWLITAHRPLTCQEFAAALKYDESDTTTATINHDEAGLHSITIFEFVSLFCGLIEVNGNRIYPSVLLQSHLPMDKSEYNLVPEAPFTTLSSAQQDITSRCYTCLRRWLHNSTVRDVTPGATEIVVPDPELMGKDAKEPTSDTKESTAASAEGTTKVEVTTSIKEGLVKQCSIEEQEQMERETRYQIPILLPYAIEHWFEFLQSEHVNGKKEVISPMLKQAVEEFVADETMLNRCLHVYKTKRNPTCSHRNVIIPSLSSIQERLDLNIPEAMALALASIRCHHLSAPDNGWQSVALGLSELNNEAALLKADQCGIFDNEKILKVAFEIASDTSSCVLAKSHSDFVQKHAEKLLDNAIRLGNSSFVTHIVSQGDTLIKEHDAPEDGTTILYSIAELVAPIPHPTLWQKYVRYVRHIGEAHKQDKRSPLHLAAISGHRLFIEEAITWIKDHEGVPAEALNDRDEFGATPLFLASQYGHFDIVAQFIAAGAKLAICDKRKQSPLHIASKMGYSKIVAELVAAGAKLDGQDRLKKTPLHLALENRHTSAAANLLLDRTLVTLQHQRLGSCGEKDQHSGTAINGTLSETTSKELLSHYLTPSPGISILGTAKLREITIAVPFMTTRLLVSKSSVSVSTTKSRQNINVDLKDADGITPLIIAVKNNMVEVVKILLRHNVDVFARDQLRGQDSIQYAAEYGHGEILELVLAAVPNHEALYSYRHGSSPLHLACRLGHVRSIQYLIKYGFDPSTTNTLGQTALSIAIKSYEANVVASVASHSTSTSLNMGFLEASKLNLLKIVEVLIDAGAHVDSVDDSGSTAMHYCSSNDNLKLMQLLISRRGTLNLVDRSHRTPVFLAAREGSLSCLKMLIDAGADVNIQDASGWTPLYTAANGNHDRAVQMLLMANCALSLTYPPTDINLLEKALTDFKTNIFRHIAGKLAVSKKLQLRPDILLWFLQDDQYDIEKMRILLENGMDPNPIIGEYGSMLHYAALWGQLRLVELLCEFDHVDINMINPNKKHGTPLQLAAYRGNDDGLKIAKILLAKDANIYKGSGFYGSALNVAAAMPCWSGHQEKTKVEAAYIDVAKLLISHEKTIINFSAGYHGTPVQFAVATGSYAMLRFLLAQEPIFYRLTGTFGTALHFAAYKASFKYILAVLAHEKSDLMLSTRDRCGRLPLHMLVMRKASSYAVMRRLVNKDVTLLTTDSFQSLRCLHLAAGVGNLSGVFYLLHQQMNTVNDRDADGWTALHWACRDGDNKEVVELLLRNGADKNATTNRGWTPFDVALYSGASMTANLIISLLLKPDKPVTPFCVQLVIEPDDEESLPPKTSTTPRSENGKTYNCDICYVVIYGPVHICQQCNDFKACFKCYRRITMLHHNNHVFKKII